jgi:hypothetical protein
MIVAPERHGLVLEVPENGAEGAEPITPEHQLVAVEIDDVQVDVECVAGDRDGDVLANTRQGNAVAVRDADSEPRAHDGRQAEVARGVLRDEAVRGPGIHERGELAGGDRGDEAEGGCRAHAGEGVHGDGHVVLQVLPCRVIRGVVVGHLQEVDPRMVHCLAWSQENFSGQLKQRLSRRRRAISSAERRVKRPGGGGALVGALGVAEEPLDVVGVAGERI